MTIKIKPKFARSKILATIGPDTDSIEKIDELINAGIDGIRLNFSHGDHQYFQTVFDRIDKIKQQSHLPISILVDLQGPKIRIGEIENGLVHIEKDQIIEIVEDDVIGTHERISTSYKELTNDAQIGNKILIDDGLVHLEVIDKFNGGLKCKVIVGGALKPHKGMNLPGMTLSTPSLTEKDIENIEFIKDKEIDFIALSFVRSENDIVSLREILDKNKCKAKIIAKIEKPEAVERFDKILKVVDGIMVARGDLGVEMEPQEVPGIQKRIIANCRENGKLVITATQMFESMINNPVPTRAEASDVANAVWDGTDVVMLSGETSVGKYPIKSVQIMNEILVKSEVQTDFFADFEYKIPNYFVDNVFDSSGKAVAELSERIGAAVIVVFTRHGRKAKVISKFRPQAPIVAISDHFDTLSSLNLYWGIQSYLINNIEDEEEAISFGKTLLEELQLVKKDDIIIFTSGAPMTDKGRKTWLRFEVVK